MKNGFIYQITDTIINSIKYINLVELFKIIALKLNPEKENIEKQLTYLRNSVDIFIVLKWSFIIIIWTYKIDSSIILLIVWYLIITNFLTYFYYHSWKDEILIDNHYDIYRIKRRFLNLIFAVFFSIFSFSYLFNIPYRNDFYWGNDYSPLNSFWFSLSNSLTAGYDKIKPITDVGHSITMIELVISFLFITIIISNSIPQINFNNKKE